MKDTECLDILLQLILSLMIIVINSAIIYTLSTSYCLSSNANLIIISLAVADLLVGIFRPISALYELDIVHHNYSCTVIYCAIILLTTVSMHHLFLVSLDRYVLITRPLHYPTIVTPFKCKAYIIISWGMSLVFACLPLTGAGKRGEQNGYILCAAHELFEFWYIFMLYIINFQVPVAGIIYMYYKIYIIARKHRRQIQSELHCIKATTQQNLNSAKILCTMCLYFVFSWTPYFTIVFVNMIRHSAIEIPILERVSITLAFSNSLGNPILYALCQSKVRKQIKKKFYWICCKKYI